MSTNSDRKHQVGRSHLWSVVTSHVMCEKAYSLIELMTVITIIAVMLGSAIIVYAAAARGTDVSSAAELLKEDIRKTRDLAGLGAGDGVDSSGIRHRDKYRILINTNSGSPPNCYKIETCTWTGSEYGPWTQPTPPIRKAEAKKIDSNGWIRPMSSSDITIAKLDAEGNPMGGSTFSVEFESKGSIVQTTSLADTTIRVGNSSRHVDVVVSMYGDVSQ